MEASEHQTEDVGGTEFSDGIADGVVIPKAEQRRQLFRIEFVNAFVDLMTEDKIEKGLLLLTEGRVGMNHRARGRSATRG